LSDEANDHIAELLYNEGAENDTEDPGDMLLEDELHHSDMPVRLIGSEDPDDLLAKEETFEVDTADKGVSPNHTDQLLAELRSQSQGRLNEITELRQSNRDTNEAMASMRKLFMQMETANAEKERQDEQVRMRQEDLEEFGKDVVNDPHMQYVSEQMSRVTDAQEAQRQQEEHYRQQVAGQQQQYQQQVQGQQQAYTATKAAEDAYVAEHPDYYDAYDFARSARETMYKTRGYNEVQAKEAVNQEEMYLMKEQAQIGGNIADQVYKMAQQWGYQAKQAEAAAPTQPHPRGQAQQLDLGRMQAGLNSQGVGQVPGGLPGGGKQVAGGTKMTADEFFQHVPAAKRMRIFMNDDDAFETLGRTGYIVVPN